MFEENALFEVLQTPTANEAQSEPLTAPATTAQEEKEDSSQQDAPVSPDLASQANVLFRLIRDFKSLADRACDAAIREAEHSSKIEEMAGAEMTSLRLQLRDKIEALDARDRAMRDSEALANEKIAALETALREKEEQLENCQARSRALLGEMDSLNLRLNEAAGAMKQAEARFREFAEHQQVKIGFLCQEIKNKDTLLQSKDVALKQLDEESRLTVSALETRLQAIYAILETKDAELREKESALETTVAHEKTVAQLMQQLAVESQALMTELGEKNELVAELESKAYRSFDNGFAPDPNVAIRSACYSLPAPMPAKPSSQEIGISS
jgi:chromosome segregation ATPase